MRAAPRILPLLMSVLTIAISRTMAVLFGVWGMVARWSVILARFSPVHAIFAEAGAKLKAANAAATTKFFQAGCAINCDAL